MLERALKYDPALFARGVVELDWPWRHYAVLVAAIAVVVVIALGYRGRGGGAGPRNRASLALLRIAALSVLAFVLLDPVLVVSQPEPEPSHVAVLIDDSLSMRIADAGETARGARALDAFAAGRGPVAAALAERFEVQHFAYAAGARVLEDGEEPRFDGARSNLAAGLDAVRERLRGRPLAAVVVVSDGGHEGGAALEDALLALRAGAVPVHTVGVGAPAFALDLEVSAVSAPRTVLRGDTVDAMVTLRHRGLAGEEVRLTAEDDASILDERLVRLPRGSDTVTTGLEFELDASGPHRIEFRVAPVEGETLQENNALAMVVDASDRRLQVLHFEGEPRFEVKFARRAVSKDDSIRLVSVVRTAENKYYRLGVEDPEELADGFPEAAEALFRYDAIVLGSIDATVLGHEQQALIADFVSRRGGGLLLLGGRHAFAEGGYAGSTLARLMPVVLGERDGDFRHAVRAEPTLDGVVHPVTRLARVEERWGRLPPLTVVNPIRTAKPGATALLRGEDGGAEPLVLLAYHRYGRGTVAALPVRDTWRWQMHRDVPLDDQTHETLWREMLRWLGRSAGGRVRLEVDAPEPAPGQSVEVEVEALDAAYRPADGADVRLVVTTSLGDRVEERMQPLPGRPGRFHGRVAVAEPGRYEVEASLHEGGAVTASATRYLEAPAAGREYHGAELDAGALQRVSAATGGEYFALADAGALAGRIRNVAGTRSVVRRLALWDAPALLALLAALACGEWLLRRRWQLA